MPCTLDTCLWIASKAKHVVAPCRRRESARNFFLCATARVSRVVLATMAAVAVPLQRMPSMCAAMVRGRYKSELTSNSLANIIAQAQLEAHCRCCTDSRTYSLKIHLFIFSSRCDTRPHQHCCECEIPPSNFKLAEVVLLLLRSVSVNNNCCSRRHCQVVVQRQQGALLLDCKL